MVARPGRQPGRAGGGVGHASSTRGSRSSCASSTAPWDGGFSFPGRPRNHPNFPRHDLLRFARDPQPRIRLLALEDPASDAALVERFSRDPDAQVRRAAADDPRLSPEAAVGLLGDADQQVRSAARRNPALPPEVLIRLLLDADSAGDAARNPATAQAVMHRMIALRQVTVGAPDIAAPAGAAGAVDRT